MAPLPFMQHLRTYDAMVHSPELLQPEVMNYAQTWSNCCSSVKWNQNADIGEIMEKHAARIRARSYEEVRASATAGNAEDVLDVGLRRYTGCGITKDTTEAMAWWLNLTDNAPQGPVNKASRSVQARALSCLAHAHFEARIVDDGNTWNIDSLYRAGEFADRCAALGLRTPTVIDVAATIERAGFRRKEDEKFPGHNPERFEQLTNLWAALDMRKEEVEKKAMKQAIKQGNNPNAYICAAEGCGIESTSKSGLMCCSGPCARDVKPSYCSKECQRQDWKRHKRECRKDSPLETRQNDGNAEGTADQHAHAEQESADAVGVANLKTDGKEHSVRVIDPRDPGKTIQMSSSTMSASFLREVREEIAKAVNSRNGDSSRA